MPDGLPDNGSFGFVPTDPGPQSMNLQTNEGSNRQGYMVHLCPGGSGLCLLDTATLLESPVVVLDGPSASGQFFEPAPRHLKVAGCPVLRVSVRGDGPKHLDESIPLEMHPPSISPGLKGADRNIAAPIWVDLSVGLEPGEPRPAVGANPLQILQGAIPTVEQNTLTQAESRVRRRSQACL